jgi:hypothetical protein
MIWSVSGPWAGKFKAKKGVTRQEKRVSWSFIATYPWNPCAFQSTTSASEKVERQESGCCPATLLGVKVRVRLSKSPSPDIVYVLSKTMAFLPHRTSGFRGWRNTMVKLFDFVLSVAGLVGCGAVWLLDPHAWEVSTLFAFIFFGCAIMAGLELDRSARNRSS